MYSSTQIHKPVVDGLTPWLLGGFIEDGGADGVEATETGLVNSRYSLEMRENTPCLASHWKYCTPATDPLFFPTIWSNTTPAHSPGAKRVSPMKAM